MTLLLHWLASLPRRMIGKPVLQPALDQMDTGHNGDNHLMVQFFEWESLPPPGISWWKHFENEVPRLASLGCTQVWLPPPNKAMVKEGRGYDAYDLWDLGEFHQKGTVATRWGTKEEFLSCIRTAKSHGIHILIDAVLNHKLGADRKERFMAVECDPDNRLKELGRPKQIEGWTAFDFHGRGDKYSSMKWNQSHFTGLDWDALARKKGIFKIVGRGHKGWSKNVDPELGNYDYLLGIDIDFRHPDVRKDFLEWGPWVLQETGAAGFRLDACKHIDRDFLREFVKTGRSTPGFERAFVVAEFWIDSAPTIEKYMGLLNAPVSMFDVPLHYNFHRAFKQGHSYDLRTILEGGLVSSRPRDAVTFVDNHDTAIGCSLESWVGKEFKPIAYALILLRPEGHPCVYHADMYGPEAIPELPALMKVRQQQAYGACTDYFRDNQNCVAFVRHGDASHAGSGCVVLCANAKPDERAFTKDISIGQEHAGSVWKNVFGEGTVTLDDTGKGNFKCPSRGISVWILDI